MHFVHCKIKLKTELGKYYEVLCLGRPLLLLTKCYIIDSGHKRGSATFGSDRSRKMRIISVKISHDVQEIEVTRSLTLQRGGTGRILGRENGKHVCARFSNYYFKRSRSLNSSSLPCLRRIRPEFSPNLFMGFTYMQERHKFTSRYQMKIISFVN